MRMLSIVALGVAVLLLGGCLNTYNSTNAAAATPAGKIVPASAQAQESGRMVINVNGGMTSPAATTFTPVSYQEVYTTEYTPCGPVVKKAIVPIYGQAGASSCSSPMYTNGAVPSGLPVMGNCPPAQPVVPAIAEPVAWFGPSASPVYSSQTNWF